MEHYEALLKAYEYGIDHGLLIAEQERDSEDLFDAFGCYSQSKRTCMPSAVSQRRQPHSQKWRDSKKQSMLDFINLYETQAN